MNAGETEVIVRGLLKVSGLNLDDGKIAPLVRLYPYLRLGADSLYTSQIKYEAPSLIHQAAQIG